MRISDWSSDVCSSDLRLVLGGGDRQIQTPRAITRVRRLEQLDDAHVGIGFRANARNDVVGFRLLPALQRGTQQLVALGEMPIETALGNALSTADRYDRTSNELAARDCNQRRHGPPTRATDSIR